MKKYVCVGGFITSKNDGDRHYVGPHTLAVFYNINPKECFFAKDENDPLLLSIRTEELIYLQPRFDGNYNLSDILNKKEK